MVIKRPIVKFTSAQTDSPQITRLGLQHGTELSDLGNAARFIESFSDSVRYIPTRGWFLFSQTHWQRADTDTMLSLARQSLETLLESTDESTSYLAEEESELHERILKHIARSQSLSRLQGLLRLVRTFPEIILSHSALDADPYLLNLRNGTLDLRSGELLLHNPEHYLTRLLPYDYDPAATSPIWHSFLDQLTGSDPALQLYLQRAIGSSLFGASHESTAFVLTGPGQRAHQLLLSTLRQLLGSYSMHSLALKEHKLSPTLLTSRLLTISKSALLRGDPALLSALLNHEPLTISRSTYEHTYEPHGTLWLSAPELPQFSNQLASLREYLQPIPLSLVLSSHEAAQLAGLLQQALPAILNWAIEGFQLWYTEAPNEPIAIQQAAAAFHEGQSPIALFLTQACTSEPDQAIPAQELYQAYATWARASGECPLPASRFGSHALACGLQSARQDSGRFYQNLKLNALTSSSITEENQ